MESRECSHETRFTQRKKIREFVWNKTLGKCWYCGKQINPFTPGEFTIDHIVPICLGGEDTVNNLVPCCKSCNSTKGGKTIEDFRSFRKRPFGIYFTKEQLDYLDYQGFKFPEEDFEFYFEKEGLK